MKKILTVLLLFASSVFGTTLIDCPCIGLESAEVPIDVTIPSGERLLVSREEVGDVIYACDYYQEYPFSLPLPQGWYCSFTDEVEVIADIQSFGNILVLNLQFTSCCGIMTEADQELILSWNSSQGFYQNSMGDEGVVKAFYVDYKLNVYWTSHDKVRLYEFYIPIWNESPALRSQDYEDK